MSSRNVLIVVLDPVPDDELRTAIEARKRVADVTVHVVAPAADVGPLQWLTGAEDEARAAAEQLADQTADAVEAEVETEVGERDPLLAVEDALRVFPADEILVASAGDGDVEIPLRRLGLPVSRLETRQGDGSAEAGPGALARDVARGRRPDTLVIVFAVIAAVVIGTIAVVTLIALLIARLV